MIYTVSFLIKYFSLLDTVFIKQLISKEDNSKDKFWQPLKRISR